MQNFTSMKKLSSTETTGWQLGRHGQRHRRTKGSWDIPLPSPIRL